MNLVITLEQRFFSTHDNVVWTQVAYAYSFWKRYLTTFDRVLVVARVREVQNVQANWKRADGGGVSFVHIPYYLGPLQYIKRATQVRHIVQEAIRSDNAVIMRVPSQLASCAEPKLRRIGHPYGVEVVGDPYDVFSPRATSHPLRPFFRRWFAHKLKRQCVGACAVAYVTKQTLQHRYPPSPDAFSTYYSSIELPPRAFVSTPRSAKKDAHDLILISVGWFDQPYKRLDVLIDAVNICLHSGLSIRLMIVGGGKYRPVLETQATNLDLLDDRVRFLGALPAGDAVRAQLDKADLFVLPSGTEGLPRAMIEAMARGLPCIGTTVGGIPELLSSEDMVPPGDAAALAAKIREVVSDPSRMARMSARNLEKAREYHEDILNERRIAFYRHVKEKTEEWLARDKES